MGLAQVVNENIKHPNLQCIAKRVIETMNDEDKESIENAIVLLRTGEARFSGTWLAKQINAEGYKIAFSTLGKHIAKECRCETK